MDTENGWRRVECVIEGPSGAQNQSLAANSFYQLSIAYLQAENFSVAGSEVASCKKKIAISYHAIFYISLILTVKILIWCFSGRILQL